MALTIADNSYMRLDSASFFRFEGTPWQITKSPMRVFLMGETGLPATSAEGVTAIKGNGYELKFTVEKGKRTLTAYMDNFRGADAIDVDVTLTDEPEESMVICTSFPKPGHFYYNQKINCMRRQDREAGRGDIYL